MLLIAGIWPRWRPGAIALIVFITTCLLELLPLWQPAWLPAIRATLPGRLGLGHAFTWGDFPYYASSGWLGWLWLRWLDPKAGLRHRLTI